MLDGAKFQTMDSNKSLPNCIDLKPLIENISEPILIKNILKWDLLKWSLSDWENVIKNEQLQFRVGKNRFTKEPQWERSTSTIQTTFTNFLSKINNKTESDDNWMYFDYKYLREWFNNIPELKKNITWKDFGFSHLLMEDSTIWIGSKGAHTSCHIDTYGCNLVAQIYGRKKWVMFPPDENLKPTRIPYEESSIYSKLNFFSPTLREFQGISNCRIITLDPGDVLFLPHKWWHFVENLDIAISINVWLPLPQDNEERFEESIVKFLISRITNGLSSEQKEIILNPNSDKEISESTFNESLCLINACKNICKRDALKQKSDENIFNLDEIIQKFDCLERIPTLSLNEFQLFLKQQFSRFSDHEEFFENSSDVVDLIEAITHLDVILLIKNKLMP